MRQAQLALWIRVDVPDILSMQELGSGKVDMRHAKCVSSSVDCMEKDAGSIVVEITCCILGAWRSRRRRQTDDHEKVMSLEYFIPLSRSSRVLHSRRQYI